MENDGKTSTQHQVTQGVWGNVVPSGALKWGPAASQVMVHRHFPVFLG